MLSPTTFISPSTDALEPKIVSSSSSSSAFLDDDVSSTSLDMRNCDVAESGLTQKRASKPLKIPIAYWKSMSYSTTMASC